MQTKKRLLRHTRVCIAAYSILGAWVLGVLISLSDAAGLPIWQRLKPLTANSMPAKGHLYAIGGGQPSEWCELPQTLMLTLGKCVKDKH